MRAPFPGGIYRVRTLCPRDGRDYLLRPLCPADLPALRQFFRRLSPDSLHWRYAHGGGEPGTEHLRQLLHHPDPRALALGIFELAAATCPMRLRALGELIPERDPLMAECAFLVDEQRRRIGLGSRLLLALRVVARQRGFTRLGAQVQRANLPMRQLFLKQGARLHFGPDADYVEIDLPVRRNKILMDKPPPAPSFPGMVSPEKKPFSVASLLIDLVLVAASFVIFYSLVNSHVPSNDPAMIKLWGGLTAGCMSGVFWLAWQMLKVVYRFQRDSRR